MRDSKLISRLIVAFGGLLVSVGAWMVVPPAGLVTLGVLTVLYGLLLVDVGD